jgi:DNA invertase Pin-like site-specific DNA recombinase
MTTVLDENYGALMIAIMKQCHPEEAFRLYRTGYAGTKAYRGKEDSEDVREMIRLNEEDKLTYEQIGSMYGISKSCVSKKIKKHKEKI